MKVLKTQSKNSLALFSALTFVLTLLLPFVVSAGTEASSNLLTSEGISGGTQSVTAYRLSGVDCSDLWNMSFGKDTYANARYIKKGLLVSNLFSV